MSELTKANAREGQVVWIGMRPGRRKAMISVSAAEIGLAGLVGDRARAGKRAVTLIQAEHLAVIGAFLGCGAVAPELLRRNLVVSEINLIGLRERQARIGQAVLLITGPAAPCSRMEEALGVGGYSAVRGHGGMTAEVVQEGPVGLGDIVQPL